MNSQAPTNLDQLYPEQWLKARHLKGRAWVLKVVNVCTKEIWNAQEFKKEWRVILDFGRSLDLILNPTQARAMHKVTGTKVFSEWAGASIMLTPAGSSNGKQTIRITPPPKDNGDIGNG